MPRTKTVATPIDLGKIEAWAGVGFTLDDIANALGWSSSTLDRRLGDDADVRSHYELGRLNAKERMVGRLFTIAMQDEDLKSAVAATIFYLKSQCGWHEKPQEEKTNDAGTARVQIYLPDNGRKVTQQSA